MLAPNSFLQRHRRKIPKPQADFRNAIKVEVSVRNIVPEATMIDAQ